MRKPHPNNPNLTLFQGESWSNLPLLIGVGPYIEEYLYRIRDTMDKAIKEYMRLAIFRFDIHLPKNISHDDSKLITRFFESLNAQLDAEAAKKKRAGVRVYETRLRYIWVKERDTATQCHYHVALLLNRDAYFTLGQMKCIIVRNDDNDILQHEVGGKKNMFDRLRKGLASALGCGLEAVSGLIHIPGNPVYRINRNADNFKNQAKLVFQRLSYLAKAQTKHYGDGSHWFGCSRM